MEAAASIIGLIAVGAKVYTYLEEFISACADAPAVAQSTLDEVRDFQYALERLKPYVQQRTTITPLGAAATDVNQLSLTLASCVSTFSQLEKTLDRLPRAKMDTIARVRWAMAGGALSQVLMRIQQHKVTLMLLLTIWISESSAQTEQCVGHLNDLLTAIMAPRQQQSQPPVVLTVPTYEESLYGLDQPISATDQHAISTGTGSRTTITVASEIYQPSHRAFETILASSKPYGRVKAMDNSAFSVSSSQRRGMQWSLFTGGSNTSVFSLPYTTAFELSGLTLAVEHNISRIRLPMNTDKVYNAWWYTPYGQLSPTIREQNGSNRSRSRLAYKGTQLGLFRAVQNGDVVAAARELSYGVYIDLRDSDMRTVLHHAVTTSKSMIEALLDRGASIDAQDMYGKSPLHIAVRYGSKDVVQVLLDRGAEVSITESDGCTPLEISIDQGRRDIIRMLLGQGAHIETKSKDGSTLLHRCIRKRSPALVELLLEQGAEIDSKATGGSTPLHECIRIGELALVELFLEKGAEIESKASDGCTPLHHASDIPKGSVDIVKLLLSRGAEIETRQNAGRTPLHLAICRDNWLIVETLLQHRARIDTKANDGRTPLDEAVRIGYWPGIMILVRQAVEVNTKTDDGRTLLHLAVREVDFRITRLLLDRGVDVNIQAHDGRTALHLAIQEQGSRQSRDIIQLLLERGAGVNIQTGDGHTALHIAVQTRSQWSVAIAKLLLDRGAAINTRAGDGRTALHLAVRNGSVWSTETVKLLLNRGAETKINATDGTTALHAAILEDNLEVVTLLIERGVEVNN